MKASELRIGNFIGYNSLLMKVSKISEDDLLVEFAKEEIRLVVIPNEEGLHPIPLTEEWLLKFGFFKGADSSWCTEKLSKLWVFFIKCDIPFGGYDGDINIPLPQYVHQLQNLYFVLTGEELTIKQ